MKLTILGSGSSSGTPAVDLGWGKCDPAEPRNRRLRPSVMVEEGETRLLVDTSPDLREQFLHHRVSTLSAVLFTHHHADHLHGIDDLRPVNRAMKAPLPAYADRATFAEVGRRFGYVLEPLRGEFYYKPVLIPTEIAPGRPFRAGGIDVLPFDQDHLVCRTVGFRFGGLAYSTDLIGLPEESFEALRGIDTWVIGVLSERPHPTHAHVALALGWIERVRPRRAVLTGMGVGLDHRALEARLPEGVEPAYDGMVLEAP